MLRLFTALEVPDHVRIRLAALRAPFPRARWAKPDDYHITLRFAGEMSRRTADEFARALADIDLPSPRIVVKGTNTLGGSNPRVIYAAIEPSADLDALARAHDKAARAVGLPAETRKYVPHITLARLDNAPVEVVAKFLERTGNLRLPPFIPDRCVLMSSREGTGGGPYGVVDSFPFPGHMDPDSMPDDMDDDAP